MMSQPEFESVKASLSRNQLFEDPDFPAVPETLAVRERGSYVTWLRPWVSSPACISYVDKIYLLLTTFTAVYIRVYVYVCLCVSQ